VLALSAHFTDVISLAFPPQTESSELVERVRSTLQNAISTEIDRASLQERTLSVHKSGSKQNRKNKKTEQKKQQTSKKRKKRRGDEGSKRE
jgi:hypothetical protein